MNVQQDPLTYEDMQQLQEKMRTLKRNQRKGGCFGCGCATIGILLGVLGGGIGILVAVLAVASPNTLSSIMTSLTGVQMPQTRAIVGDASAFDPFASYTQAVELAGDAAQLQTIRVSQVRPDGTQDLNATYSPAPDTTYTFMWKIDPPANAPPVGAGGNNGEQWYQSVSVRAYKPGTRRTTSVTSNGSRVTFQWVNEGMAAEISSPTTSVNRPFIDPPTCSIVEFWKAGVEAGFPKDAVATLEYDADGYEFYISGRPQRLEFDKSCKLKD
jgi:hypothetical protein